LHSSDLHYALSKAAQGITEGLQSHAAAKNVRQLPEACDGGTMRFDKRGSNIVNQESPITKRAVPKVTSRLGSTIRKTNDIFEAIHPYNLQYLVKC
jgi:hypothetical protein